MQAAIAASVIIRYFFHPPQSKSHFTNHHKSLFSRFFPPARQFVLQWKMYIYCRIHYNIITQQSVKCEKMSSFECVLCFLFSLVFFFSISRFSNFHRAKIFMSRISSCRYPPSTLHIYTLPPLWNEMIHLLVHFHCFINIHTSRLVSIQSRVSSSFSDFISNFDSESSSSPLLTFTATLLTFLICSSFARCYIEYMWKFEVPCWFKKFFLLFYSTLAPEKRHDEQQLFWIEW